MASTSHDIPMLIVSDSSSSERRISPSWSIATLKAKLEPVTGVPARSQKLSIKIGSQASVPIESADESVEVGAWKLQAYAEIRVTDTRPPGLRENYTDVSAVEKFELPQSEYETRTDSVLAYKRANKLGRFDPSAPEHEQQKVAESWREVEDRGVQAPRARLTSAAQGTDTRGTVGYIGLVPEIPGASGPWVGVKLDEPTGKNDGSVGGKTYFACAPKCGVFVRAARIEIGDFPVLDDLDDELNDSDEEF
ncbi:hypothetical protein B0A48_15435 [Cryoendolithus antarcticus]|uniref:CAP-Gly domain-containing protein n=1 Tax=Cryoendolithus antarcticus TaxID=1507870 RepID=A0A1V8SI63_9PEZI|nr:hypothetical protein B0A48_15435 [Cryoendolithus antarcticus]